MELKLEKNIDERKQNSIKRFHKEIEKTEKSYLIQFKPFCSRCAKIDFRDLVEKNITEQTRNAGFVEDFNSLVKQMDLSVYGKPERFTFEKETLAKEPIPGQVSQGSLTRTITYGVFRSYRCNVRKCGVAIEVPNEQIESEKKAKEPEAIKLKKK